MRVDCAGTLPARPGIEPLLQREALMRRTPILALTLALALAMAAGSVQRATAGIYATRAGVDYCGAGYDNCMQMCNLSIWTWSPPPLRPCRCNDYCAQGTNICEAHRIPRPGGRRARRN